MHDFNSSFFPSESMDWNIKQKPKPLLKPTVIIYHGLVTSECHISKLFGVKMCAGPFKFGQWVELFFSFCFVFSYSKFISFAWIVIVIDFISVIGSILCPDSLFAWPIHRCTQNCIFSISSAFCWIFSKGKNKAVGYFVRIRFSVYISVS